MSTQITVLNWNAAGAKFLKSPQEARAKQKKGLTNALRILTKEHSPDVILMQEVARYGSAPNPDDLVDIKALKGYYYAPFVAVDTVMNRHPARWGEFRKLGGWKPDDYLAQGYGVLWRRELWQASVWNCDFQASSRLDAEVVHLDTGLYTGSRDTEPRLAVVAHFFKRPFEFFVVNLHLVTLRGERVGVPARDARGSKVRLDQIDLVLDGIVSRYNDWRSKEAPLSMRELPSPVWILAGDFNCVPDSPEVRRIQQLNFLDLNPSKGTGNKAQGFGKEPTITVDYVFAGPEYVAFDPFLARERARRNPTPLVSRTTRGVSDHYPILAGVPLTYP